MVLTKQQKKDAMVYLLETVLGLDPDSEAHKSMEYNLIRSPHDLCGLDVATIETLEYPSGATPGTNSLLPKGMIGMLK